MPQRRVRVTRSPLGYWLLVAVLALLTGVVAARVVDDAGALAARYGPLRPVVVAVRALEPGSVVGAGDVTVRHVPGSLVPEGAVPSTAEARGRTVVVDVFAGVPLVAGHLAPGGRRGLGPLLPPGSRAVAVPNGRPTLVLVRGDTVDVLATFDLAGSADGAPPTFPVALDSLVVDVGDESAALAVSPDEAARVAFALAHGVVTLALASPVTADAPAPEAATGISGSSSPAGPAPPGPPPPGR